MDTNAKTITLTIPAGVYPGVPSPVDPLIVGGWTGPYRWAFQEHPCVGVSGKPGYATPHEQDGTRLRHELSQEALFLFQLAYLVQGDILQ